MSEARSATRFYIFCGIICVDDIFDVSEFPLEDSKVRASNRTWAPGGNAYNAAVSFIHEKNQDTTSKSQAKSGIKICLCSAVGEDDTSLNLRKQCESIGLEPLFSSRNGGSTPYSVVIRTNKTRTIIHHRALDELKASEIEQTFANLCSKHSLESVWFHMEGRNAEEMLQAVQASIFPRVENLLLSLELERVREGNEIKLLELSPNVVVIARSFIESQGFHDPRAFVMDALTKQHLGPKRVPEAFWVVTMGEHGSIGYLVNQTQIKSEYQCPAIKADGPVNSLGAGDTFLGALIYGIGERKLEYDEALQFATQAAYNKICRASKRIKAM